jgi:L-rhamnose mutarotase
MTQRICFRLHIHPEKRDEYVRRHAHVWPEMQEALRSAGWHNYSLFLGDDGTLIGYLECEDFGAAQAAMAATEVNARWQSEMAEFFSRLDGGPPDEGIHPETEIFHLI